MVRSINGADSIPDILSSHTASLADIVTVDVKQKGAKGDGSTNDTAAIQSAITYVESLGGGTIYFPPGTYWVKSDSTQATGNTGDGSSTPAGSCLVLHGSNITLLGAGKDKTKIICHSPSGQLNENSFALIDYNQTGSNKVWRGGGIGIMGGTQSTPQQNITIKGIELDGTAHYTGSLTQPADTTTGDGWDITHRGIWCNPDTYIYNLLIEDCYIHSFKGELTYSAGANIKNHSLFNNTFDDSNGEATNISDGILKNNTIGKMCIGFESVPQSGMNLDIRENKLNGPFKKEAISLRVFENIVGSHTFITCEYNQIQFADTGISINEMKNAVIRNNTIIDCSTYGIHVLADVGGGYQPRDLTNTIIENNTYIARTKSITNAIEFALGTHTAKKSRIVNNVSILDTDANTGVAINMPIVVSSGTIDITCEFFGNHGKGTTNRTAESMVVLDHLMDTTSGVALLNYQNPPINKLYRLETAYRVVATTNLQVVVQYKDNSGSVNYTYAINTTGSGISTGSYSAQPIMIYAQSGYQLQVFVTASVANAVYVTLKLSEV